ncbi:peptidase [Alloprevotella tannerae]|uniref:peptidase n=1 Tax=Alloprevotella tannerae TaxID=76122 RepID=UPI003672FB7E
MIAGVSGTVKYDPNTKILTLKKATLNAEENMNCIWSEIDGLTIEVSGTNELNAIESSVIVVFKPTTITGGDTLNTKSRDACGIFVSESETDLTINNCIVSAKGKYGITGEYNSNGKLLISNATVTAEGEKGSICNFASLSLEYCNITQPVGAEFDESKKAVVLNGEKVTSEIVITRNSTGINTPTIDNAAQQGIYTISGVKLNGEVEDLPKGIYIINGKKVVKK